MAARAPPPRPANAGPGRMARRRIAGPRSACTTALSAAPRGGRPLAGCRRPPVEFEDRRPRSLRLDDLALVLDLGGTRYRAGLVDRAGEIRAHRSGGTRPERGPERALGEIVGALQAVAAEAGGPPLAG